MNILFVNEYAGFVGGVEQNIALTVKALTQRGHECSLVYARKGKRYQEYQALFKETKALLGHRELGSYLTNLSPEVVYLHRLDSVEPFLNRSFHTVRMVHDHDLCCPRRHKYRVFGNDPCESKAGWRCWLDLAFLERRDGQVSFKNLFAHTRELKRHRQIDQLLVGSRSMQQELVKNGFDESKVAILSPAVPPTSFGDSECNGPNILFVGQMIKGKGPDLLLRAVSKLECDFHLTMVGDGNWIPQLREQAINLGLESRVTWTGWVTPQQLEQHYQKARVVAVPSRWPEPFGMVGLEAMQRAKPVVGFAVGGIPDWLVDNENGFLVQPPSIGSFSGRLAQLLQDPQLARRMGQRGLEKVSRDFAFDSYIDQLEVTLSQWKGAVV